MDCAAVEVVIAIEVILAVAAVIDVWKFVVPHLNQHRMVSPPPLFTPRSHVWSLVAALLFSTLFYMATLSSS